MSRSSCKKLPVAETLEKFPKFNANWMFIFLPVLLHTSHPNTLHIYHRDNSAQEKLIKVKHSFRGRQIFSVNLVVSWKIKSTDHRRLENSWTDFHQISYWWGFRSFEYTGLGFRKIQQNLPLIQRILRTCHLPRRIVQSYGRTLTHCHAHSVLNWRRLRTPTNDIGNITHDSLGDTKSASKHQRHRLCPSSGYGSIMKSKPCLMQCDSEVIGFCSLTELRRARVCVCVRVRCNATSINVPSPAHKPTTLHSTVVTDVKARFYSVNKRSWHQYAVGKTAVILRHSPRRTADETSCNMCSWRLFAANRNVGWYDIKMSELQRIWNNTVWEFHLPYVTRLLWVTESHTGGDRDSTRLRDVTDENSRGRQQCWHNWGH
jgi:hypothetical protein